MKKFEFKNVNNKSVTKGLVVAAIYLIAVFALFYYIYGGFFGMIEALDGIGGGGKAKGLVVGLIVLVPFMVILQFIHPKVSVEIDPYKMVIKSKSAPDQTVELSRITKMNHNVTKINKLNFYDSSGVLIAELNPAQNQVVLGEIIKEILSHQKFEKQMKTETYFGKSIEKSTYMRS